MTKIPTNQKELLEERARIVERFVKYVEDMLSRGRNEVDVTSEYTHEELESLLTSGPVVEEVTAKTGVVLRLCLENGRSILRLSRKAN
jgi:hypothetical protein